MPDRVNRSRTEAHGSEFVYGGRCYWRPGDTRWGRWSPSLLVLRGKQLSLIDDGGLVFESTAGDVVAEFTRSAGLRLKVGSDVFLLSHSAPNGSALMSPSLLARQLELDAEVLSAFASLRLGKPPTGYWRNWRPYLIAAGCDVHGTKGLLELLLIRLSAVVSIVGLASLALLVVWLIANGGRPL